MRLRHFGITVGNMEESVEFYRDFLGFEVVRQMDESGEHIDNFSALKDVKVHTIKMRDSQGQMIELLYYHSHPRFMYKRDIADIGCSHFAVTVDDLDETLANLATKGYQSHCEPQISPDGKVKLTFLPGPDNVLIELVEEL
jgi:catechol 2,3-dioxygenase-like lactoylglutathione lyase family enzyme|tara:strand:- start:2871 stop:3293 length:423 start_codon:yes stop_codon:yes gene_type:complete